MLNALRAWGKRYFSPGSQPTVDQGRQTSQQARDDRAHLVQGLRDEIHRLQHEITVLNDAMAGGTSDGSARANEARMASLHRELALKQQELGKYQARI